MASAAAIRAPSTAPRLPFEVWLFVARLFKAWLLEAWLLWLGCQTWQPPLIPDFAGNALRRIWFQPAQAHKRSDLEVAVVGDLISSGNLVGLPLPALRGEGWGEGLFSWPVIRSRAPHPLASLATSPRKRGEVSRERAADTLKIHQRRNW